MSDELLLSRLQEGVLRMTLNRPKALNALTQSLMNDLVAALDLAARDPAVSVVVLEGAGDAFCAGADRFTGAAVDSRDPLAAAWSLDQAWTSQGMREARLRHQADAAYLLYTMPKPTIAVIKGAAAGAGLALAAACDFRLASSRALFRTAYVAAGYSGDFGCGYLLARLVGAAKARELMFLNDKVDATSARECGMVNWLVEPDEVERRLQEIAGRLAAGPPIALGYMKRNFADGEAMEFRRYLDAESQRMISSARTQDAAEALNAFKEKRSPVFKGQ